MKKLILASVLALGLGVGFAYAENKAATELEHQNKTANEGAENVGGDMSAMKAAGKCNADQSGKIKTKTKAKTHKPSKSELELEHANKLPTGVDGYTKGMGNMKAQGKCNTK
jgi:hypothetical protein